jgi:hypothetical protein
VATRQKHMQVEYQKYIEDPDADKVVIVDVEENTRY